MIAALLSMILLAYDSGDHGDVTAQQTLTFTTSGAPTVRIQTTNGAIHLKTGGAGISVTATKRAESQAKLSNLKVTSSQSGNRITITAEIPSDCDECGSIEFDASVPAGAKVELQTINGSVTATGLSADSQLGTTNGSVRATYASATNVRSIALATTNGSVTLGLPANAKVGRIRASTVHGGVSSDWTIDVSRGNYGGATVDQTLQPGGISLDLKTQNGSITVQKN
jgi:DUF4097 and DUF4098 domain-containing protein YvlB